jgi:hypothetical protein
VGHAARRTVLQKNRALRNLGRLAVHEEDNDKGQYGLRSDKVVLCLMKCCAMKTYVGVRLELHAFLTSALNGGEWSASFLGHFTAEEDAHGTSWVEVG